MGGADTYCAICGGPLGQVFWEVEEDDQEVDELMGLENADNAHDGEAQDGEEEAGQDAMDEDEAGSDDDGAGSDENEAGADEDKHEGKDMDASGSGGGGLEDNEVEEDYNDEENGGHYNPKVILPESSLMDWLRDVRMIGENPESQSKNKVYISGLATEDDVAMFDVERGTDPNFFQDEDQPVVIQAYRWATSKPIAFPFHQSCFHLLQKHLPMTPEDFDKEVLYSSFKKLAKKADYQSELGINYRVVKHFMDQYWAPWHGFEFSVMDPFDVPELASYLQHLPVLKEENAQQKPLAPRKPNRPKGDPFMGVAPELMLMLLTHMDMRSVMRLRAASRAFAELELGQGWWHGRLARDQPWLFELRTSDPSPGYDWARVYRDLRKSSTRNPKVVDKIHGLVNRRRIWEDTLPQISPVYRRHEREKREEARRLAPILEGAKYSALVTVVSPSPKREVSSTVALVPDFADLPDGTPEIVVEYDPDGYVTSLDIGPRLSSAAGGNKRVDKARISQDDWLTGLIITTSRPTYPTKEDREQGVTGIELLFTRSQPRKLGFNHEGEKSLLYVPKRRVVVGLQVFRTHPEDKVSTITKITLISQPQTSAMKLDRFMDLNSGSYNRDLRTQRWERSLPPPGLKASKPITGYWPMDVKLEHAAMEQLVFGTNDEELSRITAIAADVRFGGFELTLSDGTRRSIGPELRAMKSLSIDGAGGERIVAVYTKCAHIPTSVRFVTNRARQLVIGATNEGGSSLYPAALPSGEIPVLAGFFAWWKGSWKYNDMAATGYLYNKEAVAYASEQGIPRPPIDERGYMWRENPPPEGMRETGRIFGESKGKSRLAMVRVPEYPGWGAQVSWLDCSSSRPLDRVTITTTHSSQYPSTAITRVLFEYADGTAATSDIDYFNDIPPLTDPEDDSKPWCWCLLGHCIRKETATRGHYEHDTWEVKGQALAKVMLYTHREQGYLSGIQLEAADGSQSPRWGHWDLRRGEDVFEHQEIQFKDGVQGLKLFWNNDGKSCSREDMIMVCAQAITR